MQYAITPKYALTSRHFGHCGTLSDKVLYHLTEKTSRKNMHLHINPDSTRNKNILY